MRFPALIASLVVALIVPATATADKPSMDPMQRAALNGSAKGTPHTCSRKPVIFHQRRAKQIVRKNFKLTDPDGHTFGKKSKAAFRQQRDCLLQKSRRQALERYRQQKKARYKSFAADPFPVWYSRLPSYRRDSLERLAVCENSGRNHGSYGDFGFTHWFAIPNLISGPAVERMKTPMGANSWKAQSVIVSQIADRYSWGGWPSCTPRPGTRRIRRALRQSVICATG